MKELGVYIVNLILLIDKEINGSIILLIPCIICIFCCRFPCLFRGNIASNVLDFGLFYLSVFLC